MTAYSTGERRGREDKRNPHATLVVLVPKGKVIHQPGKQARLEHAQQETHRRDAGKALRAPEGHGHAAPAEHEERDPAAGAQLLEEHVAGDLEDGVGDEEDHEGDDELVVGHVRRGLHVVAGARVEDLGVADVGAVEEAEEVDGGGEGDDAEILLPDEAPLCLGVDGRGLLQGRVLVNVFVSWRCEVEEGIEDEHLSRLGSRHLREGRASRWWTWPTPTVSAHGEPAYTL